MPRLFIGIELPDQIKQQLIARQRGIPEARWQAAAQLHLTLNFIGDVEEGWLEGIHDALGQLPLPPFEVALRGVGRFGKAGRPQVIWAGVVPREPLAALHALINERLADRGLPTESRQYTPHVTLARLRKDSGNVSGFLEHHADLHSAPFAVARVSLFQSTLSAEGACYRVIGRFPLAG